MSRLAVVLVAALAVCAKAATFDVFVSTNGVDAPGSGTKTSPYKTIGYAQQQIRSLSRTSAINVWVMGGNYFLEEPLTFTPADSGAANAPVTYAALPGSGPVVVSGGVEMDASLWMPPTNPATNMWTAQLPADTVYFRQMFVNNERAVLARTPTMEYVAVNATSFTYTPGQLPSTNPHNFGDTQIVMYESWTAPIHQIESIDDVHHVVTLKTQFLVNYAGGSGNRYYAENFLEALDQPGEFYYDRVSHVLSYIPPAGVNPSKSTIILPRLLELVNTAGNATAGQFVSYINWVNITFSHTAVEVQSCWESTCDGQSAAFLNTATLHLESAHNWRFDGVTVSHTGGYGAWINQGCSNNVMDGVHMFDLGAGGLRVGPSQGGVEANVAMRNVGTTLVNSVLEQGGKYYQEGCGVFAQQVVALNVSHNIIRNFSYTGVSIGWTWGYDETSVSDNYVGFNDISFIGLDLLSDMGCVYTLGHQPNSLITNNVCHDIISFNYGGWGLYTDEGSRDLEFTNNIIYRSKCAGLHQHYGLDNLFHNNVFADVNIEACDGAIRSSPSPGTCTFPAHGPMDQCTSFVVDTNIFYALDKNMFMGTIVTAFDNVTFTKNDYWSTGAGSSFQFPHGDSFSQWQAAGKDKGSVVSDPEFVSPQENDYTKLQPGSPALSLGFVPIDVSNNGPLRTVGAHADVFETSKLPPHVAQFTR